MTDNLTVAYALIVVGLVLLVAELFLPTFGVLMALSIGALVVGIAITFANNTSTGLVTLLGVFIVAPTVVTLALNYAPKTRFGRRLFLSGPDEDDTLAHMPVNVELEQLRGRYGRTVSALRPSGIVDFDGRRVDTLSEGALIEPGQWVRCIDVKAGRVVVRQVDRPPDLADLDTASLN